MATPDAEEENIDLISLLGTTRDTMNKKRRRTNILIIIGVIVAISLYILFSYWHPFWRYQSGYVSAAQFGEDWPFTISEARVICAGPYDMLLQTRAGTFGLTSNAQAIGYQSLEESTIWKYDPNGWQNRVPADKFWLYINTLCK
ncbi:MAG: hypothetical protein FIA98_16615 [Anaerolineae bacterium]|nr:hypothetical protein [Anaerolineae bacterium]